MKNDMIWGFMLYLSNHMWRDETSAPARYAPPTTLYTDNINTEIETWDKIIPFLAERKK